MSHTEPHTAAPEHCVGNIASSPTATTAVTPQPPPQPPRPPPTTTHPFTPHTHNELDLGAKRPFFEATNTHTHPTHILNTQ